MSWFRKSAERLLAVGVGYATRGQARYFFDRGGAYAAKDQHDRAISDFTEAIRLDPQEKYFWWRGGEYKKKGDYDRAIADYDEAIRLDPNESASNFFLRGDAYDAKGDTTARRPTFAKRSSSILNYT